MPRTRPPKKWFYSCVKSQRDADDPKAVCGAIWRNIRPSKQRAIRKARRGFK